MYSLRSAADPHSLVCDRCWADIFNTPAFEEICRLRGGDSDDEKNGVDREYPKTSHVTTMGYAASQATKGCS